jgi:FtsZ-interacting cell division protein ZipA
MNMQIATNSTLDMSPEELAEILQDLQAQEKAEQDAEGALDDELEEELLQELAAAEARASVYESQTATPAPTLSNDGTAQVVQTTKTKAPRQKSTSAAATPRTPRKNLADLDDGVFQLYDSEVPGPANKAATLAARPRQVKIAEKFDNLFLALSAGKEPSSYVVTAFKVLSNNGTMTSGDLVAAYKSAGLVDGTANSQTGQIMELFNVVGIARRAGRALTMRSDSVVARKLASVLKMIAA